MGYGTGRIHRPMWPEYKYKHPSYRELFYYERGTFYDKTGRAYAGYGDERLDTFLSDHHGMALTESLSAGTESPLFWRYVTDSRAKVICSRQGQPILIRCRVGRKSYWICTCKGWSVEPSPSGLRVLDELFDYIGVGTCPTYSSLGTKWQRRSWSDNDLQRHSCPSLGCEQWLHRYTVGGITWSQRGHYDEATLYDIGSAYLSKWAILPTGTSHWFVRGHCEAYATYFALCTVTIHSDLALGPFPLRRRDWRNRVIYPTLRGKYDVYLWKEQVDACKAAGCDVEVHRGWGWSEFTSDPLSWAQEAYRARKEASASIIEEGVKKTSVAGMGHHGMDRIHYYLVDRVRRSPQDRIVFTDAGEPLDDYFVHEEYDMNTAFMVHWVKYVIMLTNLAVYYFALPYAIEGRLVSMDYDSVMVLESDGAHQSVRKHSIEALTCPPGTWLWTLLHNVDVLGHRRFKSDELTRLPGTKRKEVSSSVSGV